MEKIDYCITGANGFSGSNLVNYFLKKKKKLIGISKNKNKVRNTRYIFFKKDLTKTFTKEFEEYSVDWFIHSAAHHKINDFKNMPIVKKNYNQGMVDNIVKLCKKKNIRNLIFFSTIDINFEQKNKKKKLYIKSKINSEKKLIKSFNKNFFDKLVILRLPAIIGKNCNDNFLKTTYKKLTKNKKIKIWNPSIKYDNFVHIHDVNKLIEKIVNIKKSSFFEIIECKSSKPIKLIELIIFLKKKLKSKSKIQFLKSDPNKKIKVIKNNVNYSFLSTLRAIKIFSL